MAVPLWPPEKRELVERIKRLEGALKAARQAADAAERRAQAAEAQTRIAWQSWAGTLPRRRDPQT